MKARRTRGEAHDYGEEDNSHGCVLEKLATREAAIRVGDGEWRVKQVARVELLKSLPDNPRVGGRVKVEGHGRGEVGGHNALLDRWDERGII